MAFADPQWPVLHPAPGGGHRVLPPGAEAGGGAGAAAKDGPGGHGRPGPAHRAQSAPGGAHH